MSISFTDLRDTLHLPAVYKQKSDLSSLKKWCHEHISQDIFFSGSDREQYDQYQAFARDYLEHFLPHLPKDLAEKTSFFKHLNPIHYAAQEGYDYFISKQTSLPESIVNEADTYKMTALHKAATRGYEFTVRALLSKGANAHLSTEQNQLPIHKSLFVPIHHDADLIKRKEKIFLELLPLSPEALSMEDLDGNTLLHHLATSPFDTLAAKLIQLNPELPFLRNNAGLYPIHTAILNQQTKTMDLLLTLSGVADLGDSEQRLPLHYAARYGTAAMVQACCQATADIDSTDSEGRTALLWAASAGNEEAFKILIENGADTSHTDYKGFSILHFAVNEGNESIVHWIVDNLGDSLLEQVDANNKKPMFYAKQNNDLPMETLLKGRSTIDRRI